MPKFIPQDHLGPSWGSLGGPMGSLHENTQNLGKYQEKETERVVKSKS